MSKRQDRRVKRRHLRALPPNPKTDPIAIGAGVVIVSFFEPIPELVACHYCHTAVATTRDHIVPKAKRGTDAWWNLVPACEPCNRKKTDNDTTCHCAFCSRAVFLFELGHMRPAKSPRLSYIEKPIPKKKRPKPSKKKPGPFDVKAPPLPDDLSHTAYINSLPKSFPGST